VILRVLIRLLWQNKVGGFGDPDSLIARIMKAKYYPKCSILEASVGRTPSFAWRIIHGSCDLLREGYGVWVMVTKFGFGRIDGSRTHLLLKLFPHQPF
jgi:hypothetical protein